MKRLRYKIISIEHRFFVYQLSYPNGTPFYIGVASVRKYDFRPNEHLREADRNNGKEVNKLKSNIIRKILRDGSLPKLDILFSSDDKTEIFDQEKKLIENYGKRCDNSGILANISCGGEGITRGKTGKKDSKETIKKRVENSKGKTSNFGKQNGMFGKKQSEYVKEAVRLANTGRKQNEDSVKARAAKTKITHMLKHIDQYEKIMNLLNQGKSCKEVCEMMAVSHDMVTKVRKEKKIIEEIRTNHGRRISIEK